MGHFEVSVTCAGKELGSPFQVTVSGGKARAENAIAEGEALHKWHCGHQAAVFEVRVSDEYGNLVSLDNFQQNLTGALEGPHAERCTTQEISSTYENQSLVFQDFSPHVEPNIRGCVCDVI